METDLPMDFDFAKDYVLENKRTRLEPLQMGHEKVLVNVASEEEVWTYFLGKSNGKANFGKYILDSQKARAMQKEYAFAVYDKARGLYAGSTRFFDFDKDLNTVRLGYTWYGKSYWGTGLNKNCKFLLFQFAFEQMEVERVGLGAHAENVRSISAMESVGCKREGVVRNLFPSIHKEGRADAVLLGILKDEWFQYAKNDLNQRL